MFTFNTLTGETIVFEDKYELVLEEVPDVQDRRKLTFLVTLNDHVYAVSLQTFNALSNM